MERYAAFLCFGKKNERIKDENTCELQSCIAALLADPWSQRRGHCDHCCMGCAKRTATTSWRCNRDYHRVQVLFKAKSFKLPGVVCAHSTKHADRSWTLFKSILVSKICSAAPVIGPHLMPPWDFTIWMWWPWVWNMLSCQQTQVWPPSLPSVHWCYFTSPRE